MIITKTPLRMSLIGGGTDLPSFYKNNKYGLVVSAAINKYIYVSVKKTSSLFDEKFRLNYSNTELVKDIEKIENPIIRESLKFLNIDDYLYISTIADVPASTGLGSSSAFCVGLLNALYKLRGVVAKKDKLAEEAAYIEIEVLKRSIGKQDHYATAFGGLRSYKFLDNDKTDVSEIEISNDNKKKLFNSIISFWTGITRSSESTLKEQNLRQDENLENLLKMRHLAIEMIDLLENNFLNIEQLGKLIHSSWILKKTLASNISNDLVDKAYKTCLNQGAIGGKISGAGNGGFLNIITPNSKRKIIVDALSKLNLKQFKFNIDENGTKAYVID